MLPATSGSQRLVPMVFAKPTSSSCERVERRAVLTGRRERPWVGVRVRAIMPTHPTVRIDQSE